MTVAEFQRLIEDIYFAKDSERGLHATFTWFVEEVGELARALRQKDPVNLQEEFADVFAWLATTASIAGVELEDAVQKYRQGCPKCQGTPCTCAD
jgi:NTP pyrophosphatase (non-canonical NTP hydrolase)